MTDASTTPRTMDTPTTPTALDTLLAQVVAQPVLFAARPTRLALQGLELAPPVRCTLRVNVWRNHAIENLLSLAAPYFAFAGIATDFRLGHYDDSLQFAQHQSADVELLWLDSERYLGQQSTGAWAGWLLQRVQALRARSAAPIVLASWIAEADASVLQQVADACPATYFADLGALCAQAGVALTDRRTAAVAGTPLANAAQPLIARKLACHWLAGAALPPIKAVVLDLDHTLHAGVLGEDGVDGVSISAGHAQLQRMLSGLRQRGIFLALASRNERHDVEALFAQRSDYPLRWSDFSATEVSWQPKAQTIAQIAHSLRISPDAMLFVDDNAGELSSVRSALPQLHVLHADTAAELTERAIEFYPGLWRWRIDSDDAKRVQDLQANAERAALQASAADSGSYFSSLQVELGYALDPSEQLARAAALCQKTNQFNLALRRFGEAELAQYFSASNACVAMVSMRDRLADSGNIAIIVAERSADVLRVEELCISCRAMGRGLEDTVVMGALAAMPVFEGCSEVAFVVRHGPRNGPALEWLAALLGSSTPPEGEQRISAARIRAFQPDPHLTLTYHRTPQ
ncbi:HAD-IIIC family phosphatase [Duganella qianjiadongensis]|nr:HAD-IIIC family phosphatase [Duganella qianjiadongensis]